MLYIIITLSLLFFSYHFDFCGKEKNKFFWYNMIFVVLILVSGLRYRLGIDTTRYLYSFYHDTPYLWQLSWDDLGIGNDPLFKIMNSVVYTLDGRFYVVQLIHALIVNGLVFNYIKKHSPYIFTCVLLFFLWNYLAFNMEEMRASMSVAICLFANDYILERKWLKGLLLYFVGCLFHVTTIFIILLIPFLFFLKLNKLGVILLLGVYILGGIIMSIFEENIALLSFSDNLTNKTEYYMSRDDLSGQMGNVFYYIVSIVPFILYPIVSNIYIKKTKREVSILQIESPMMIGLLFLVLQMQIYLAYRFVNFYSIYLIIFVAWMMNSLYKNEIKLSCGVGYTMTLLLFSYFILAMLYPYYKDVTLRQRYYPYASIFEQSIDKDRELIYSDLDGEGVHHDEF